MKYKFRELTSRLTGVSIPVFGVSWTAPEPERKVVRDLLVFLEDRRALYNPYAFEIDTQVSDSVLEIRKELTEAIRRLPETSNAVPLLRALRASCREYLNSVNDHQHRMRSFMVELGKLRSLFGVNIAYLAIEYGIDIEGELAAVVPPQFKEDENDRPTPSRLRRVPHRN
jgi:hypothetical protein